MRADGREVSLIRKCSTSAALSAVEEKEEGGERALGAQAGRRSGGFTQGGSGEQEGEEKGEGARATRRAEAARGGVLRERCKRQGREEEGGEVSKRGGERGGRRSSERRGARGDGGRCCWAGRTGAALTSRKCWSTTGREGGARVGEMILTNSAPDGVLEGDDSLMIELPDHLKLGGGDEDQEPLQLEASMLAPSHEQQLQNIQQQQQQQQQQGFGVSVGTSAGSGAGTILCTDDDLAFSLEGAFFTPNSADAMQVRWGTIGASSPMMDNRIARAAPKHLQRARSVSEMRSVSSSSGSPRGSYTMELASPTAAGVLSGGGGEEGGAGLLCGGGGEEGGANPWAAADHGSKCALADDAGAGLGTGRWTELEHSLFLEGVRLCGKEWRKVAEHVKTRSAVQTRTHAQKYFLKEARVGVGLIAKADAAAAPNIFRMNQPSERLLQQEAQSTRLGKRKPAEIVPMRNKRSSSLPTLDISGLADESRSGSSLRSLDAADVERDTAHFIMGEEVLLPPPRALANAPRKATAVSPKSRLKPQQLIQASVTTGPSLGPMLPRDNLLWPGIGVIDRGGEQLEALQNLQPPPQEQLQMQMQQQELDAVELVFLFDEHGAHAHD